MTVTIGRRELLAALGGAAAALRDRLQLVRSDALELRRVRRRFGPRRRQGWNWCIT
jgi:hypothetical protein